MPTEYQEFDDATDQSQEIDSKYRLIILAAKRSKQLQRGARPRIDIDSTKHKPTRIALEEVIQGKIHFFSTTERDALQGLEGDSLTPLRDVRSTRASGLDGNDQTQTGSKPKSK